MSNADLIEEARRWGKVIDAQEGHILLRVIDALEKRENELRDWEEFGAPAYVAAKDHEISGVRDERDALASKIDEIRKWRERWWGNTTQGFWNIPALDEILYEGSAEAGVARG